MVETTATRVIHSSFLRSSNLIPAGNFTCETLAKRFGLAEYIPAINIPSPNPNGNPVAILNGLLDSYEVNNCVNPSMAKGRMVSRAQPKRGSYASLLRIFYPRKIP